MRTFFRIRFWLACRFRGPAELELEIAENASNLRLEAERGEFELPVPICEQSDDSIRLSFCDVETNCKALSAPAAHF
jgi:hypothetical protein